MGPAIPGQVVLSRVRKETEQAMPSRTVSTVLLQLCLQAPDLSSHSDCSVMELELSAEVKSLLPTLLVAVMCCCTVIETLTKTEIGTKSTYYSDRPNHVRVHYGQDLGGLWNSGL